MKEILSTSIHSSVAVVILFILTRILGKKQISQLTFFDYVIGISIGSIAAEFAIDPSIDYAHGITGLIIFALFPIVLSFLSYKSYIGRKLFDGVPIILIQNGKIIEQNLKKSKLNVDDLLEECRIKNAFDISQIEYAIFETSGKVSVQMKSSYQSITPKDVNLQTSYKGLCINLIVDGKIIKEHLLYVKKDEKWLLNALNKQNINSPQDVILAYLDTAGELHCHIKNYNPLETPIL